MSGYGCSFVALGTLAPPGEVQRCHAEVVRFLVDGVGVGPERIVLRASSEHPELLAAARAVGGTLEVDGYDQARYRHIYGVPGLTGRNTNVAIRTSRGTVDVANVIVMDRDGRRRGRLRRQHACGAARRPGPPRPRDGGRARR